MILFLRPYFELKPWAGNDLEKIYECPQGAGEAWIVSGFKNKSSIVKEGVFKGMSLRSIWINHPELFGDYPDKEFPVLLKLISAKEDLSVQVHPNDDYALKTKNSLGKFECWYILPETKAKYVTLGVGVKNACELKDIIDNNLLQQFLIKKPIEENDLIIVEPGTIHAIHGDSFILEIQESSDITYRLYDYNREPQRELHIKDSLNVIHFNNNKNRVHKFEQQKVFENTYFIIERNKMNGNGIYKNKGFEIVYVLSGKGKVNGIDIKRGDSFLFTIEKEEIIFEGDIELIIVTPKKKERERIKMRKVALITGVTNQDGYYLTKLLLEKNYEVHGIIQSRSQLNHNCVETFLSNSNYMTHVGDLTDASNINRIVETVKPDEIYHIASQSHIDVSFDMPEYTTDVNSLGTLRILDAIRNSEIRTKMFSLSTPYMFSGDEFPQNEKTTLNPHSPYAVSKVYAYQMGICYRTNYNLFVSNGICYNHESIKRDSTFVAMKIINCIKNIRKGKKQILELGNLNAQREWGHAEDYATAMWLCLQQEKADDYVLSIGKAYTIRQFVTKAFSRINIDLIWVGNGLDEVGIDKKTNEVYVKVDSRLFRPNDAKILVGDSTKFSSITQFKFKYDLESLIDSLLEE